MPSFTLPSLVKVGSSDIGLTGSLSLTPPTVAFPSSPNRIEVTCGCSGTVQLSDSGASLVEAELSLSTTFSVDIIVNVSPTSLAVQLDLSKTTVSAVDVSVEFGPPLVPVYSSAVQSSEVLSAFTTALRSIPAAALTFTIPGAKGTLGVSYSGVSVSVNVSRIVVVPVDGVLNIAADVSGYTSGDESGLVNLITTPSPSPFYQRTDFSGTSYGGDIFEGHSGFGLNIAIALNTNFLCALVNGALNSDLAGTTTEGVTINSLALSVAPVWAEIVITSLPTNWYDSLVLNLSGSYSGTPFTVVAAATPVMIETLSASWLDIVGIQFDLSVGTVPWWESVFFPVCAVIGYALTSLVNTIADSIVLNMLASSGTSVSITTAGSQAIPGVPAGWNLNYTLDGMVVWAAANELDVYAAASVTGPPAAPSPPAFSLMAPPVGGWPLTDLSPIPVTLSVSDASLFNPALGLRIAWKAVRQDTGAVVLNLDSPLTASTVQVAIERSKGDAVYNNTWLVSCEVYRPADALVPRYTYYTGSVETGVTDVVDRHHPYFHWTYDAWFHEPYGPPPLKSHHFWNRLRKSRIHRTDVLQRCIVVDWAMSKHGGQSYLDTLDSFGTLENVESWRHGVLCDYCFFGGPTRTTWKTPTSPTPTWE